jgi:hypothetical protein
MNTSPIRRFGYVAGASATALMLVEACSDAVGEMMVGAGNMMADAGASIESDAGELLSEAGQALADAGASLRDGRSDTEAQTGDSSKSGSRIEMRRFTQTGSDGSVYQSYIAPFDTQLKAACTIQRAADGKQRCLPSPTFTVPGTWFADASCTQSVAYSTSCDAAPGGFAFMYEAMACSSLGSLSRVYTVGAAYTGTVYAKNAATCTAFPPASIATYKIFLLGAELPASSFVEYGDATSERI